MPDGVAPLPRGPVGPPGPDGKVGEAQKDEPKAVGDQDVALRQRVVS